MVDFPQPDSPTSPSVSPSPDREAHPRHGVDGLAAAPELDHQVVDLEHRIVAVGRWLAAAAAAEATSLTARHLGLGIDGVSVDRAASAATRRADGR